MNNAKFCSSCGEAILATNGEETAKQVMDNPEIKPVKRKKSNMEEEPVTKGNANLEKEPVKRKTLSGTQVKLKENSNDELENSTTETPTNKKTKTKKDNKIDIPNEDPPITPESNTEETEDIGCSGCFRNFKRISILIIGVFLLISNPSETRFKKLLDKDITAGSDLVSLFIGSPSQYTNIERNNYLLFSIYNVNIGPARSRYLAISYSIFEL